MRTSTTDPITMNDVPDPTHHPFVIEGEGDNALKIYFEKRQNRSIWSSRWNTRAMISRSI